MMECIEYNETMGKINLTEEMISVLKGLPLEDQAKHFSIISEVSETEYSYGEDEGSSHYTRESDVEKCSYTRSWIVNDGIIVGVVFSNWNNKPVSCFLDKGCCTYSCSDDDGVGSTDVTVMSKLIWKQ